ncbi:MAG: glycine cleavage system protein T, partial [Acidimicrobiales bacterium]
RLAVMLSEKGSIFGDFALFALDSRGDDRFLMTGSGPIQEWHMRWFDRSLPAEGVSVRNVTDQWMGLNVVGPRSRELLTRLTRADLGPDAFPFLAIREIELGLGPVRAARISLTGELGFELWIPAMYMRGVYTRLLDAGADLGIRNVGTLAMLSMRLEKDFGIWGREFSPDYAPSQNSMHRFVDYSKRSFIGREAALADREAGPTKRLITLAIGATTSDA